MAVPGGVVGPWAPFSRPPVATRRGRASGRRTRAPGRVTPGEGRDGRAPAGMTGAKGGRWRQDALPPDMSECVTRQDWPRKRRTRPWWTTRSMTAAAIWSSPKTVPHMPNSRLVVKTSDWRS